jgi:hypothetical protein
MEATEIIQLIEFKRQSLITLRESIYRANQKKGIEKPNNEMKILSKKVGLLTDILNEINN